MSNKLTVGGLREELQKRGLDTTGLKATLVSFRFFFLQRQEILHAKCTVWIYETGMWFLEFFCFQVDRLDAAIAEEEAEKSANVKKDDEKVDKRKRSSDASPDEESKDAKRIKVEDVSTLNAKELKDALSTRGLSTSGKKAELVERLTEAVKEQDQSADVIKVEDISNMNVKELKEALSTRGLPTNGKKSELVERLTEALDGKATDKTAATSVEDDEGVNLFFTLQHLFISIICRNEFRY
jgi:phenylpyruvate tautomerase PptA (4-oxalocrotonate tautomerase family)